MRKRIANRGFNDEREVRKRKARITFTRHGGSQWQAVAVSTRTKK